MKQYQEMKKKHPDAILLFRVGDFYECYKQDALDAIEILNTDYHVHNTDNFGDVPYTRFPHHALDTYLPKIVRAGKRVVICEQLEDPKPKGIAIKQAYTASEIFGVFRAVDGKNYVARHADFHDNNGEAADVHGYLTGKPLYEVNNQTALFIQCRKNGDEKGQTGFIIDHISDYARAVEILDELTKEDPSILPTPDKYRQAIAAYKKSTDKTESKTDKTEKNMETKNETKNTIKEINCNLTDEQLRKFGEPDAYFRVTIPKECKGWGKQADDNYCRPTTQYICIEPGNGKIIVTNTKILHTLDIECDGIWPQGDKPFQCFIDPKAISAFAGKETDIAVWTQGRKVTACETIGALTQSEVNGIYPDYARVIPAERGCNINIAPDELKRLREFVKINMGKTKQERKNRFSVIHAAKNDSDTLQVRIVEYDYNKYPDSNGTSELASEQFRLANNATHYAQIIFNTELFYYAIQEDFNGEMWIKDTGCPMKFLGEIRKTILMPAYLDDVEQYVKSER